MTFPATNPALARALAARGYAVATSVQQAVLEDGAAGRDLLVSAQTGSGKTVAFGLALGATLLGDSEQMPPVTSPKALIVAPTRELALQVARELTWLYEATGARVVTCVGGMDARAEARQLEGRPHIVVGTPGRLRDHLERGRLHLANLAAVVLDEADEMLDLGFREDLEFILDATPAERRTLLFSATLPRDIETLAKRYQRDALRIETVRRNEPHADIDYWAHRVVPHDVENTLVNVLRFHEARAAIVFCATREAVNRINARLIERGFSAVALSGELTQHERTRALQALRDGRARVLVATDVAARGLDLPDVALVIHAELPNDGETLLHRSGRTGRAGKKGLCVLIVPFNRRRKADVLIASARIKVTWKPAPPPEQIRARDQERFLADASFTTPATEEETQLVRTMQGLRTADEIALALVRLHRAQLPAPEELAADTGPPPRREWKPRDAGSQGDRPRKPWQRDGESNADRRPRQSRGDGDTGTGRARREDPRPMSWFRINIGRERNADPRWLLPLICRAGGVTKTEIGAIRIEQRETRFQILAEAADQFELAARTAAKKEGHIVRVDGGAAGDIGGILDEVEKVAATPTSAPARPGGARAAKYTTAPTHGSATGGAEKPRWRQRPDGEASGFAARPAKPRWSKDVAGRDDKRGPAAREDRPSEHAGAKFANSTPKKKKHRSPSPPKS
ncbi:MAG: DEAD/DEAH box helicase [Hyphomicrobiaceae bacterium]